MRNHGWANDDKKGKDETNESPNGPKACEDVFEKGHCFLIQNSKVKSKKLDEFFLIFNFQF